MSIKSQKSLNEECSEIFEKSYSVRSVSEESLSCEDEDESLARELVSKLTPAVLSKLRRSFKRAKDRSNARDIDRRVEEVMRAAAAEEGIEFAAPPPAPPQPLCLDEQGFVAAVNNIFGHHKYSTHAHQLFRTLDPFGGGRVWWRQVVGRLVAAGARKTSTREERWTPVKAGGMKRLDHCKRETIVKLVSIEREDSFCYAAVSKGGRVGVYSGQLKLLNSYEVFYHRTGLHRRVKNCWITDALYLSDVQCLLLAASDRSLTVYDVTTLTHTPLYCITSLPNIPTCLAYNPAGEPGEASELIFGTERGDLARVRFLQPRLSLFYTNTPDNINYYFWMELTSPPHTSYCSILWYRNTHARAVRRVAIVRDGDIALSCSHEGTASVRSRHLPGKLEDYVFKVQRGVSCFHVVSSLHLLVTGSADGVLRLWDTTQGSPFARLAAPGAPAVLDTAVVASEEIIVAYCSNCVVYIWDLYEECLLQTVKIKFPFLGVLGKRVEFGTISIHPGPARKKEIEEDVQEEPTLDILSRRGSSVYRGSTGGLILQPETKHHSWESRGLEQDPEYIRFNRVELLITCCDYVFTLVIGKKDTGTVVPPPGDTLRARRPSYWELPSDLMAPLQQATPSPRSLPTTQLLAPEMAEYPRQNLDELLESAGLQGILEKDFVLMQGLKHDLNKKIYEMESNMEATRAAVAAGAPYLALRRHEPAPLLALHRLAHHCERVARLYPRHSVVPTPSGSDASTPRQPKPYRL